MSRVPFPPRNTWQALLELAIQEDLGGGDLSSIWTFQPEAKSSAKLEARQDLIVCGLPIACETFHRIDRNLSLEIQVNDGEALQAGDTLLRVQGSTRSILAAERTALNFLGRMCGVATHTKQFVDAVAGTKARIVDTRKTLPGWRHLDKYATATGGALNHRMGLYDAVLLKDNHLAAAGSVKKAVEAVRQQAAEHIWVQVEVENLEDALAAADAGADSLLLDNQDIASLQEMIKTLEKRLPLEASGGVRLSNVHAIAETGIDRISIGALTHSAPNADLALEFIPVGIRA